MSEPHALYRFYDSAGGLLYVGITNDPGRRWRRHADDKPWWQHVTRIDIEQFDNRDAVLIAERDAIRNEQPKHNIMHNRPTPNNPTRQVPQLDRLKPIQPGDWAALGLADGRCPVGEVVATDSTWIALRLKEWLMGGLTDEIIAVRWTEIERITLAYPEDAAPGEGPYGRQRVMQDGHLGDFQTAWRRTHFPDEQRDPVDAAQVEARAERSQQER